MKGDKDLEKQEQILVWKRKGLEEGIPSSPC